MTPDEKLLKHLNSIVDPLTADHLYKIKDLIATIFSAWAAAKRRTEKKATK